MRYAGDTPVYVGTGNVFEDLGLDDADELTIKGQLTFIIRGIIKRRRLTQVQAAAILGIDQPRVSDLMRYHTDGFSLERLLHFIRALGVDVKITLKDAAEQPREPGALGRLEVVAAG